MAIFRCKMCGGDIEVHETDSAVICEFCGTQQTLPKVKDENLQMLFNRANVLRMKAEFDRAAEIYEKILQVSETEAEAYWGLILCKYGIEYVEDPATFKRVPTCHRTSYDAVITDDDYKKALQYADVIQREIYEEQAKQIDEIQKGIISLAQKEEPYDVFICYKETDETGKRTQDSVIANDIYYQLTQEGFKVFYAAITLEDKLGQEYEPYIFSALHSAKVMLSLGTKPEFFNAVWVKNEWSRFLKIMKEDRDKMLIPCYRDMDAYELPEEFVHLQAQDMSKIGFINDIVRGIRKVIEKDNVLTTATKETVVVQKSTSDSNTDALVKRGIMALEDGEWRKADDFFEKTLNQDAERGEAYLGKFLAKNECSNINELLNTYKEKYSEATSQTLMACSENKEHIEEQVAEKTVPRFLEQEEIREEYEYDLSFPSVLECRKEQKELQMGELGADKLLIRARQYAEPEVKTKIDEMITELEKVLDERVAAAESEDKATREKITDEYEAFIRAADVEVDKQYNKALEERETVYQSKITKMKNANKVLEYEMIRQDFLLLEDYKDSKTLADQCKKEVLRLEEEQRLRWEREKNHAKKVRIRFAVISVISVVLVFGIFQLITKIVIPSYNYKEAVSLRDNGDYKMACDEFGKLGGYKDSKEQIKETKYLWALKSCDSGDYKQIRALYQEIGDFKDLAEKVTNTELKIMSHGKVGDTVYFGDYNGMTDWKILAKGNGRVLILSDKCVSSMMYNEENEATTWETCSLRKWLNETYINEAFSESEKKFILSSKIKNGKNKTHGTAGGKDTMDSVFLLSLDEVNQYLPEITNRFATLADGTKTDWWLRSPGIYSKCAFNVSEVGTVYEMGATTFSEAGVRPAMWIDISSVS